MKNILLLGATGSIGDSVLKVISQNEDSFNLFGRAAGINNTKVEEIIKNLLDSNNCLNFLPNKPLPPVIKTFFIIHYNIRPLTSY